MYTGCKVLNFTDYDRLYFYSRGLTTGETLSAFVYDIFQWPNEVKEIRILFLEGPEWKQKWVEKLVEEEINPLLQRLKIVFLPYEKQVEFPKDFESNLKLNNIEQAIDKDADVYMRFQNGLGNWALIGSTNQNHERKTNCNIQQMDCPPTFNYNGTEYDTTEDFWGNNGDNHQQGGTVLHEVCHILGFQHEHTHPEANIEYNWKNIDEDLMGPPNYWDKETIRSNFLASFETEYYNGTEYDPLSIMMYPLLPEWTLDGMGMYSNKKLSIKDKKLLKELYSSSYEVDHNYPGFLYERVTSSIYFKFILFFLSLMVIIGIMKYFKIF